MQNIWYACVWIRAIVLSSLLFLYVPSLVQTQTYKSPTTIENIHHSISNTKHTSNNTQWSRISPLLEREDMEWQLPIIPSYEQAIHLYGEDFDVSNGAPFAKYEISDFHEKALLCDEYNTLEDDNIISTQFSSVRGGPLEICDPDYCKGPVEVGSMKCRAIINHKSVMLVGKFGTYWAKALATPAWIQFTFPQIPFGSSSEFHFSFTLDQRYRPELYGGNACNSTGKGEGYICQLCTAEVWDHNVQPGLFLLWSAAGRDSFLIDGPYDHLMSAFDSNDLTQNVNPPIELALQPGEFPVITLMTFSQYPAFGEVDDISKCSVDHSNESGHKYKDKPIMIEKVSMMYRSELHITKQPHLSRPRLYGTDSEWMEDHVTPFFDAPCDPETASNAGWFDHYGYLSFKSHFDLAARGFLSCNYGDNPSNIGDWDSLKGYFDPKVEYPSQRGGFRALHLLRRLWYCADSNQGDYSTCEYNLTETRRLALAVASKEMVRFHKTVWSCGVICGGNSNPAFDLTTAEQVGYFVTLYDILVSRPDLLSPEDALSISTTLDYQMDLFLDTFWTFKWQLWNGNNWTPHLCIAAMEWAVAFWHEKKEMANEVLHIVNDIMWIHRNYYTSDGVYVEGVMMYAIMSIEGQMAIAALSRPSFGFAPQAINVEILKKTASFMIASMSTDGYTIDFGDSHRKRGWSDQLALIEASMAPYAVHGGNWTGVGSGVSITHTQVRAFSASLYGSGGIYTNPWRVRGHVLKFDSIKELRNPTQNISQPLGGARIDYFPSGGYANMLTPLLSHDLTNVCFDGVCLDPSFPSLLENIPYSTISLQARKNTFAHSEVDFATFIWSAWGSRLISEFGYGTISTSVSQWDMRRYSYLDNNPAGHNTIIIREAFPTFPALASDGGGKINFSQLNYISGTMSKVSVGAFTCILMDGSLPYGASRLDGWLDVMKRYVCQYNEKRNLLIDVIKVKENRTSMNLYGSQYGGPDFHESTPANQRLTIDEYFYIDTAADIQFLDDDVPIEILPFDRTATSKCSHVDVDIFSHLGSVTSSVILRPRCGIGSYRDPDGIGQMTGFSVSSRGEFQYDGLITSADRWGTPHTLKKRRIRFVSNTTVGTEGDVRAFVLAPYRADQLPSAMQLNKCNNELGCNEKDAIVDCSCIQDCSNNEVTWIIVINGNLSLIETVGTCHSNSTNSTILNIDLVNNIKDQLGFKPPTSVPTPAPTPAPIRQPSDDPIATNISKIFSCQGKEFEL